ncbi:hypothetical protein J2X65_000455 [Ancylobacter sp. 3268]|uniref:hypothetical protein n=1 Tax=Ancylobacter sp. 3268 TaxID=2817752 RepID=UPI002864728A|nr:hypothetical protein [Ancylobacter sp. 3268]MDR6951107.1 hypothetical protein [Ancylobacter sp. 3268]
MSRVTLFALGVIPTTLSAAGLKFTGGSSFAVEVFGVYLVAIGTQNSVPHAARKPLGSSQNADVASRCVFVSIACDELREGMEKLSAGACPFALFS